MAAHRALDQAFEEKIGRTPAGKLTAEIVELIKATPIIAEPAKLEIAPLATAEPAPSVAAESAAVAPLALTETEKPLPAPPPLLATTETEAPVAEAEPCRPSMPKARRRSK